MFIITAKALSEHSFAILSLSLSLSLLKSSSARLQAVVTGSIQISNTGALDDLAPPTFVIVDSESLWATGRLGCGVRIRTLVPAMDIPPVGGARRVGGVGILLGRRPQSGFSPCWPCALRKSDQHPLVWFRPRA